MNKVTMAAFKDELTKIAIGATAGMGLLGAGLGGYTGALAAPPGEERWRSALRGAAVGGGVGAVGGHLAGKAVRRAANLKVGVQPTDIVSSRKKYFLFGPQVPTTKSVTQMKFSDALNRDALLDMTDEQKAKLWQHGARAALGTGIGTLGAAAGGVIGARHLPAAKQFMQHRAPTPMEGGYYGGY